MLLEPIRLTLYDPETQEIKSEYKQRVITLGWLLAATQLQEVLAEPEKKRRWWWQKPISQEAARINALMEFVVHFFGEQFTVEELQKGADVSEVMAVYRSILSRPNAIVSANPTVPPPPR